MKKYGEIKKELKAQGIEIKKQLCTLNGQDAYKVYGSEKVNDSYLFTKEEIVETYYQAGF